MAKRRQSKWYRVYSTLDRGEGSVPRYCGGACHPGGVTRERAEELAARERARPYTKDVRIEEVDSQF